MRKTYYLFAILIPLAAQVYAQPVDKMFQFTKTSTPQGVQELTNVIRSIAEVPQASVNAEAKTIAVRGTAAEIALADWLLPALDRTAGAGPAATVSQTLTAPEFRYKDGSVNVVRIFYPAHLSSTQQMQDAVNMIRSIAELQRVVGVYHAGAIVGRGGTEQIALTEWLLDALAKPPTTEAPVVPMPPRFGPFVTRVFYAKNIVTPQDLSNLSNEIRTKTGVMRLTIYPAARAIALRGTPDQATQAEKLIQEADKPLVP